MAQQVSQVPMAPTGPSFSQVVCGIWRWDAKELDDAARSALFNKCISLGITTFDGADIYGGHTCEQLLGRVLQANPQVKRQDIQIVTKCGICLKSERHPEYSYNHYDTTKEHILRSVRQTLEDLQTSYVDLLLIHRPDFLMNPDDVAEAFAILKHDGLVRHFGVSNFTPAQFDMLSSRLAHDTPLVTNQVELNPVTCNVLNDGTLDQCIKYRFKPMLWSPLKHMIDTSIDKVILDNTNAVLSEIASAKGLTVDKVSIAWGLQHPSNPVTIVGTTKPERIQIAADAINIKLTREEWFRIWCAGTGRKSVP